MNTNQKLAKAISDLIPEAGLMELRVGQRMQTFSQDNGTIDTLKPREYTYFCETAFMPEFDSVMHEILWEDGKSDLRHPRNLREDKILGIEPELRHLLWALRVKENGTGAEEDSFDSILWGCPRGRKFDLTLSLFNQTEGTKQFLLNLLTN